MRLFISTFLLFAAVSGASAQYRSDSPFMERYVRNHFVPENTFTKKEYTPAELPVFQQVRKQLPQPVWDGHDDYINCYWKAWEIAFSNLRQPEPESGFVANYVTTGFNNHIFMWGHVFMFMYWKYGLQAFPYQQSLENFYAKQHPDGYISREINERDGSEQFARFDLSSTGPNIFPWGEWEYFQVSGDLERLAQVFPVLVANKQWVKKYRTWQDGSYFANGWSSGMDNQPRLPSGYSPEFDHGHMSWIDITLQQLYMDKILLEMADLLGRRDEIHDIEEEYSILKKTVNNDMWNDAIGFYVDRFRDGSLSDVKSIGAYWSLLAGIVPDSRVERFCAHLADSGEFARHHRIPSLSADTPGYADEGEYWRGGVWAITNFMTLKGLVVYGKDSLAHVIARNHLHRVVDRYRKTGTIWENYAPEAGFIPKNSRPDFVGFSGVSPVSIFIENILGIRSDVPNDSITWDVRLLERHGITHLPFGLNATVDLMCEPRKSEMETPVISASSTVPLTLTVKWKGGTRTITITPKKSAP